MATPVGRGAIATVLIEGPGATGIVDHFFRNRRNLPLASIACDQIVFGCWHSASSSEELVVCRRATDDLEIHCHGGRAAPEAVLRSLEDHGCQLLTWQEFLGTRRIEAEATEALSRSETERTAAILLQQHAGVLSRRLATVSQQLRDRQPDAALQRLNALLDSWPIGKHLTQPWQVVVAGAPNVGKSSLVNALLGFQRSIVSSQAGTTRDLVVADTAIDGWPIRLIDTAGLRPGPVGVEEQGIALARQQLRSADLVLEIRDTSVETGASASDTSTSGWPGESPCVFAEQASVLTVWNKSDLVGSNRATPTELSTSAVTGSGIGLLIDAIGQQLVPCPPAESAPILFTPRQRDAVGKAIDHVRHNQLDRAAEALSESCR